VSEAVTSQAAVTEIAPGVHRCGTVFVNWYLVADDDGVTVVDTAVPRYWPQLDAALARIGRAPDDVRAVVLTHAHVDHTGFAERLRSELGVPVHLHAADERLARTGKQPKRERSLLPYLRHATARKLLTHLIRNGAGRVPKLTELQTFTDGATLDVPGRPRAINAPGHTAGCCALHFAAAGALLVGDVLCSRNTLTGRPGPQVPPGAFNDSSSQALDSLAALEPVDAAVMAFGHGDPWTDGVGAALTRARELGPS
jgi:glyoxylase-like metal-dependent hydrolase (beta-lactamase superfamily II)